MADFRYKFLAPLLAFLLFDRPRLVGSFFKKTGLELALMVLSVRLFRRAAVHGSNLFAPEFYRQLNPTVPSSFFWALWYHLKEGEARNLNPTYFFSTSWFRREYARLLPSGASPLVFFLLRQKKMKLRPHPRLFFYNPGGFFRILVTDGDGGLNLSPRRWKNELKQPAIQETPQAEMGWSEIGLDRVGRLSDWCRLTGARLEKTYIAQPQPVTVPDGVIGPLSRRFLKLWKAGYSAYLAYPGEVMAIGGETALMLPDGAICRDGNVDCPKDSQFYGHQAFNMDAAADGFLEAWRLKELPVIERGLLLMSRSDAGFWHWMVEILPRLVPIWSELNQGHLRGCPIIISDDLPPTQVESLRLLAPLSPLIPVPRRMAFKVREAIYPSEINRYYRPPQDGSGPPKGYYRNYDIRLDIPILVKLRDLLLRAIKPALNGGTPDKIIIERVHWRRSILNGARIRAQARQYGFIPINPVSLGFAEQVAVYHGASCLLIPGGAGVVNAMFARKGTTLGILGNDMPGHLLSLWQAQAVCSEARLFFINGQPGHTQENIEHDDVVIPPERLIEFFAAAGLNKE